MLGDYFKSAFMKVNAAAELSCTLLKALISLTSDGTSSLFLENTAKSNLAIAQHDLPAFVIFSTYLISLKCGPFSASLEKSPTTSEKKLSLNWPDLLVFQVFRTIVRTALMDHYRSKAFI